MRWSLVLVRALAVLALWIGGDSGVFSQNPCPCSPRDLCQPIPADHQYQVEPHTMVQVLVFYHGGADWIHYDWSKVTTVVALHFPRPDLVCHAHANKVRIVTKDEGDETMYLCQECLSAVFLRFGGNSVYTGNLIDILIDLYITPFENPKAPPPNDGGEGCTEASLPQLISSGAISVSWVEEAFLRNNKTTGLKVPVRLIFWTSEVSQSRIGRCHSKSPEFIQEIQITDRSQRDNFIKNHVNLAKSRFLDGINLETWSNASNYRALIQLLRKATDVFHQQIPGSQVSFNVPWAPDCPDDPCNHYVEMANSCDFFFVKSYNVQYQMWDECFAKAGAPDHQIYSGLSAYIKLGIDSRKLVMGVPWFGYDYPCQRFYEPGRCELEKIPVGGAPCSSKAGRLISYKEVMQQLPRSITGRYWDDDYKSPYYVYRVNNTYHEVWYDDPESISLKSLIMKKLKLRGIGAWTANYLNYTGDPTTAMQTEEMWNALCPIRGKWRT
ncbi:di-N-acetylchitobiase-like [Heterodontus francisci]|uniref:di-N-acetylchitobiase-like n=1 Tax=Heterodontus francisci TaxID=7792 RepID=UPI00355C2527